MEGGLSMLPLDIHNVRAAVLAAAIAAVATVLFDVTAARAQIAVTDPPVEEATALTAKEVDQVIRQVAQDVAVNTQTMQSVTTGGGSGLWQPQAPYLTSLNANLDQGVDTPA